MSVPSTVPIVGFEYNCCYHRDLSVNFHYVLFTLYLNLICTEGRVGYFCPRFEHK